LAKNETDYKNRLIEIYGYPYADDIGPTGNYPQGYDGPDLLDWQILDLENLVFNAPTGQVMQVDMYTLGFNVTNDFKSDDVGGYLGLGDVDWRSFSATNKLTVYIADNGLKVKDPEWTGHRRAQGELQLAFSDFVQGWYALEAKAAAYSSNLFALEVEMAHRQADYTRFPNEWQASDDYQAHKQVIATTMASLRETKDLIDLLVDMDQQSSLFKVIKSSTTVNGIVGPIPASEIQKKLGGDFYWASFVNAWIKNISAHSLTAATEGCNIAQAAYENEWQTLVQGNTYKSTLHWSTEDTLVKLQGQEVQSAELMARVEALGQCQQRIDKLVAEGDRLILERAQVRARGAQRIQMARYGDLAFRVYRDDALRRYQQAFDLAARYTYLAAKAYDYETGLLQSDTGRTPGSKFLEDVVRARAPGRFYTWLGTPMLGSSVGEPGLADLLARMKADWDVVKGRFGFNNPQTETSRFSLRSELCKISPDPAKDSDWATRLDSFKVANLHEVPEFIRYCRPYIDTTNIEPALVIPFSTCVIAGENYFGKELAVGGNAYNASYAATKVRSMGVWFTGYNSTNNSSTNGLANEPQVYLIPVGEDVMRSPTRNALQLRHWQVLDQAIPLPYNIGGADIDNPDWQPVIDSLREPLAQIRRFASFRAYHDSGGFDPSETCTNGRLVGRSVWNTSWLLIIPGRTLLSDPNQGIERFVNGIKDIKIFFQTYSIPGD
jgi:hypothetical protein